MEKPNNMETGTKLKNKLSQILKQKEFAWITKFQEKFPQAELFIVGGAIRDLLLNKEQADVKDFDFVIRNVSPEEIKEYLKEKGDINLVGQNFGVFKFVPTGMDAKKLEAFDLALPRQEYSTGEGGYKSFEIQSDPKLSIEEDLRRRDFTINAIAFNINTNEIIDPFAGMNDLEHQIIKTATNADDKPENRLKEDYSRMLRAIRIACQLNFEIEPETFVAIKKLSSKIKVQREDKSLTSYELISKEIVRAFFYNPIKAWQMLEQTELLENIIPEITPLKNCEQPHNFHSEGDVFTHTGLALEHLSYFLCPSDKNLPTSLNLYSDEFQYNYKAKIKLLSDKITELYGNSQITPLAIFGLMFHDLGKPASKETPEKDGTDRIRFSGHEQVGSDIAKEICNKLRLSSAKGYHIDCADLTWLVKHHMQANPTTIGEMKENTIAKYFLEHRASKELMLIHIFDGLSTIPEHANPSIKHLEKLMNKLITFKPLLEKSKIAPPINGKEVMKILKIKPGHKVGIILEYLKEKLLKGEINNAEEAKNHLISQEFKKFLEGNN